MLIYPLTTLYRRPEPSWLPLGLSFLASALRQAGHEVKIFDRFASAAVFGPAREKINALMLEELRTFNPDLVGLNAVSPLIYDTAACAELLRSEFSGPLLAGGHHPTAMPELTLQKIPQLDGLIQGEGEAVLPALASGAAPLSLPGVWWNEGDSIKGSPPEQLADLDNLPFPALDLLDMDFYTRPGRQTIRSYHLSTLSMVTSRGCTRRCDFCAEHLTYGPKVRMHSPEYVLAWIENILARYKIDAIYFHDNDFLVDRERTALICESMITAGLHKKVKFAIQARVNNIDPQILQLLKKAGCILIEMGIEAASQDELDAVHKGTTGDMNLQALEMCRRAKIPVHAYMLQGFEGETVEDLEKRLAWIKNAGSSFTVSLSMLELYPGTSLYRKKGGSFFETKPWTAEEIKKYYQTDHLSAVPAQERERWLKTRFKPEMIRRNRWAVLTNNNLLTTASLTLKKLKSLVTTKQRTATPKQ